MKLQRGQITSTLVCVILGLMLAIQFRTTKDANPPVQAQRVEDLTRRLAQVDQERTSLQNEMSTLRNGKTNSADAELITARAGLTRMTGTGIQVTMDDRNIKTGPGKSDLYLIRDDDILLVLNELKAAGAEAISVNGQRIIATTEVRNAGPALMVNNFATSSPIEIKAIGDPATLENALKIRGGVIETRQIWGIQITVTKQQNLEIPMYKGPQRFNYAKPVKEGAK